MCAQVLYACMCTVYMPECMCRLDIKAVCLSLTLSTLSGLSQKFLLIDWLGHLSGDDCVSNYLALGFGH